MTAAGKVSEVEENCFHFAVNLMRKCVRHGLVSTPEQRHSVLESFCRQTATGGLDRAFLNVEPVDMAGIPDYFREKQRIPSIADSRIHGNVSFRQNGADFFVRFVGQAYRCFLHPVIQFPVRNRRNIRT